jgi:hypothetical protein
VIRIGFSGTITIVVWVANASLAVCHFAVGCLCLDWMFSEDVAMVAASVFCSAMVCFCFVTIKFGALMVLMD